MANSNGSIQDKPFRCKVCSQSFKTEKAQHHHQVDRHPNDPICTYDSDSGKYKCNDCSRCCQTTRAVEHHYIDRHMYPTVKKDRKESRRLARLRKKAKKIAVDKSDLKISVKTVKNTMDKMMGGIYQLNGSVYNPNIINAGSYAVKTKIGKADEFDTNVSLNVTPYNIQTFGNLHQPDDAKSKKTPRYAAVMIKEDIDELKSEGYLNPQKVKQDIHNCIESAIESLNLKDVDLSKKTHGPASTLIIHQKGRHDTSVDVTPSIPAKLPLSTWPRQATYRAFGEEAVQNALKEGTHLVPKNEQFWDVSYSKMETALFMNMDAGNGCRKQVHKQLKKELQTCQSRSSLPCLSSYILKNQMLWTCENHPNAEYWKETNLDVCLIETMKELEQCLRKGVLPNYFNTDVNILEGKDKIALETFAKHIEQTRLEM